jgi:zinc protease
VDVAALLKDYKGEKSVSQGEAFDVGYAAIDARTQKFTLMPALKVAIVPRSNRGSMVSIVLNLHFVDEQSLQNRDTAGSLCANMLMRGTEKHTRQQIKDELDRLKAEVNIFGDAERASVRITTTRENLPATLSLVAEILRTPSFPDTEFATALQEQVTAIQYYRTEPQPQADLAMRGHFSPYPSGHVRHVRTFDEQLEDLKKVTVEEVKAFHRDFFGANGEMGVVGDVDPKGTVALLDSLLGNWKSAKPFVRITDKLSGAAPIDKTIETPDKASAVLMAGLELLMNDDDADFPAMMLGNYLIGGGTLKSRLADRIRQKEGLSYGVGSFLRAYSDDRAGFWGAFAIYNPANADKLMAAFKDEIALALKDGFRPDEIASAKLSWKQGLEVDRSKEAALASQLAAQLRVNRDMRHDATLEANVMALTNEQILAVLRKRIDPAKIAFVKAGDFAKVAKAEGQPPKSP